VLQDEAVVKVYGSMNGIMKLASKMCSPGTPLKFDASINELTNLAKQVGGRLVWRQGLYRGVFVQAVKGRRLGARADLVVCGLKACNSML